MSSWSSCCTRGAACHRDCCHSDTYASPESNPGGTHSGGADDGDGSACERTRIARRHGTDGAANEGHHRGAGTASGAAARVGDAQVCHLGHRAVLGGQRAIETVVIQIPTPARNRTRGGPTAEERTTATGQRASGRGSRGAMARTARRMRVIIGETGLRQARPRGRRRTGISAWSSCCTRGAACHRDCCHSDPYASPESNPGGDPQRSSGRRRWVSVRADADRAAPWHGRRGE